MSLAGSSDCRSSLVLVRFDPWWFGRDEDIIERLLSELLKSALQEVQTARSGYDAALADTTAWMCAVMAGMAGTAQDYRTMIVAMGLGVMSQVYAVLRRVEKEAAPMTLWERHQKLVSRMSHLDRRRFLVMVDDLDRLQPREVYDVLRAVRGVLDLPNTTFVLALDLDHAADSIRTYVGGEGTSVDGRKYLEKFSDAEAFLPRFDAAPPASRLRVSLDYLRTAWVDLTVGGSSSRAGDAWRLWEDLFDEYLPALLTSTREAARVFQQFRAGWQPYVRSTINPADFLALTVLQVVRPDVHRAVGDSMEALTNDGIPARRSSGLAVVEAACRWPGDPLRQAALWAMMGALFPVLRPDPGPPSGKGDRRVRTRGVLEAYYRPRPDYTEDESF